MLVIKVAVLDILVALQVQAVDLVSEQLMLGSNSVDDVIIVQVDVAVIEPVREPVEDEDFDKQVMNSVNDSDCLPGSVEELAKVGSLDLVKTSFPLVEPV